MAKLKHSDLISLATEVAGSVRQLSKLIGTHENTIHRWNINSRIPKKEFYDKLMKIVSGSLMNG